MKAKDIKVGHHYLAKVSGKFTTVRVTGIRKSGGRTVYDVLNTVTGRSTVFRSAQRFRMADSLPCPKCGTMCMIVNGNLCWHYARPEDLDFCPGSELPPGTEARQGSTGELSTSLAERLRGQLADTPGHLVVRAYAGTGKTFTEIMGVAWTFLRHRWAEIEAKLAEIRGRPGLRIVPSDEQRAVWDRLAESAGAKTVVYCAFNRSIVTAFSEEWGWLLAMLAEEGISLQFATVNSLGHKALYNAFGRLNVTNFHTENLIADVLHADPWELKRHQEPLLKATSELVALCKLTMVGWTEGEGFDPEAVDREELDRLIAWYDIDLNGSYERVVDLVPRVLSRSLEVERNREIDFNDQNWLPIVLDLPLPKVDLLLIDESQDLCRAKQEFARKLGRRIVLVGDVHQAIYGFAGADTDSIPRMQRLLSDNGEPLESLHLTETRRCGRAIVAEAQRIVPDFRAHESNPEGLVRRTTVAKYGTDVQDADMVLCRVNAPLISQALKFIKNGRKAVVRGRDFGGQLATFVGKLHAADVPDLVERVDEWARQETAKENRKRNPSDARLMAIEDRRECVLSFAEDAKTVGEVVEKINLVFAGKQCPRCGKHYSEDTERCPNKPCKTERDPASGYPCGPLLVQPQGIVFSSVHRAKGLESDRVFLLTVKGATFPHPMAKSDWQRQQEYNCLYIAVTRAKEELVYVTD